MVIDIDPDKIYKITGICMLTTGCRRFDTVMYP